MKRKLLKKTIFRRKIEIDNFFKKASKVYSHNINFYIKREREGNEKVAFFISKRVGKAHERNRSKRVVREYYRNSRKKFANYSVIFIIKKKIENWNDIKDISRKINEKNTDINN